MNNTLTVRNLFTGDTGVISWAPGTGSSVALGAMLNNRWTARGVRTDHVESPPAHRRPRVDTLIKQAGKAKKRHALTQAAIGRAVKATIAAGVSVRRVEIDRDKERDKLTIIAGKPDESNGDVANEWDEVLPK
jgi:hypothetical protein